MQEFWEAIFDGLFYGVFDSLNELPATGCTFMGICAVVIAMLLGYLFLGWTYGL